MYKPNYHLPDTIPVFKPSFLTVSLTSPSLADDYYLTRNEYCDNLIKAHYSVSDVTLPLNILPFSGILDNWDPMKFRFCFMSRSFTEGDITIGGTDYKYSYFNIAKLAANGDATYIYNSNQGAAGEANPLLENISITINISIKSEGNADATSITPADGEFIFNNKIYYSPTETLTSTIPPTHTNVFSNDTLILNISSEISNNVDYSNILPFDVEGHIDSKAAHTKLVIRSDDDSSSINDDRMPASLRYYISKHILPDIIRVI